MWDRKKGEGANRDGLPLPREEGVGEGKLFHFERDALGRGLLSLLKLLVRKPLFQ